MKMKEVPYSHPRLNELEDGYWVIEVYTYQGNTYYLHDPELKTVSGFDGAYRYADEDVGIKELKRHRSAFMKRHSPSLETGKFVRVTPTYVSVHYAGELLKKKLGYFPASGVDCSIGA